jgi:hypothetical protein
MIRRTWLLTIGLLGFILILPWLLFPQEDEMDWTLELDPSSTQMLIPTTSSNNGILISNSMNVETTSVASSAYSTTTSDKLFEITYNELQLKTWVGLPDSAYVSGGRLNQFLQQVGPDHVIQLRVAFDNPSDTSDEPTLLLEITNTHTEKDLHNIVLIAEEEFARQFRFTEINPDAYSLQGRPLNSTKRKYRLRPHFTVPVGETRTIHIRFTRTGSPFIQHEYIFGFNILGNVGYSRIAVPVPFQIRVRNPNVEPSTSESLDFGGYNLSYLSELELVSEIGSIPDTMRVKPTEIRTHIQSHDEFVTIHGDRFQLGDTHFRFAGVNLPHLLTQSLDTIDGILTVCSYHYFTAVRVWAGIEFPLYRAIQPKPGQFNLETLYKLDYIVRKAKILGIRIIFVLGDATGAYGGPGFYSRWCTDSGIQPPLSKLDFYTHPCPRRYFKSFIQQIATRYKDEPSVLGYELMNCIRGTDLYDRGIVQAEDLMNWIREMAQAVKEAAPKQFVGVGDEGFLKWTDESYQYRLPYNGHYQMDWEALNELDEVDYLTFQLLPWQLDTDFELDRSQFKLQWIKNHVNHPDIHKPMILSAIASKNFERFDSWIDYLEGDQEILDGIFFWKFTLDSMYEDLDDPYAFAPLRNLLFFYRLKRLTDFWIQPRIPYDFY